jgi:hypothetical protein
MADTPRDTTKIKSVSDWAARKPDRPRAAEVEQRRLLWEALRDFIHAAGGWVVSLPGLREIRIEAPQGSSLPAKLIELGYSPRICGSSTRITPTGTIETITHHPIGKPITRHHPGIVPVDILEIELSGR